MLLILLFTTFYFYTHYISIFQMFLFLPEHSWYLPELFRLRLVHPNKPNVYIQVFVFQTFSVFAVKCFPARRRSKNIPLQTGSLTWNPYKYYNLDDSAEALCLGTLSCFNQFEINILFPFWHFASFLTFRDYALMLLQIPYKHIYLLSKKEWLNIVYFLQ